MPSLIKSVGAYLLSAQFRLRRTISHVPSKGFRLCGFPSLGSAAILSRSTPLSFSISATARASSAAFAAAARCCSAAFSASLARRASSKALRSSSCRLSVTLRSASSRSTSARFRASSSRRSCASCAASSARPLLPVLLDESAGNRREFAGWIAFQICAHHSWVGAVLHRGPKRQLDLFCARLWWNKEELGCQGRVLPRHLLTARCLHHIVAHVNENTRQVFAGRS